MEKSNVWDCELLRVEDGIVSQECKAEVTVNKINVDAVQTIEHITLHPCLMIIYLYIQQIKYREQYKKIKVQYLVFWSNPRSF